MAVSMDVQVMADGEHEPLSVADCRIRCQTAGPGCDTGFGGLALVGTSVGPYQVLEKLGAGGMGEVFLCHDTRLHRKVALKCLATGDSDENQTGLLREARAAARLTHPHIAGIYDVLEHDGRAFIVMEYVEGASLRSRLLRGSLSPDEAIAIGRQLADALAAAHEQGVIHRDLKPSNVQLMPDGKVKVLDFGVAKMIARLDRASDVPTTTDVVASRERSDSPGTPVYMAPEQLVSGQVDARSDIYSLGVVLFEMTTGRRPYLETNAVALAVAMTASPPPPPDAIDPRVPRRLSSVIVKALQREPFNRYQSAGELRAALDELTEPTTHEVVRPRRAAASRRVLWTTVVGAALFSGLAMLAFPRNGPLRRVFSGAPPRTLAILPVDNPTDDPRAGHLGSIVASVAAANLRSIEKVHVVPREVTARFAGSRRDVDALRRAAAADYVLDLTITRFGPSPEIAARLSRTDPAAVEWQATLAGGPVQIEDALMDGVIQALTATRRQGVTLRDDERARLHALPTRSDVAMMDYADANALLDRSDLSDNVVQAIDRLQQAVDADNRFALGYAALASAVLFRYERTRDSSLIDRASAAVATALRLDARLSASQYASGYLQYVTGRREDAIVSLQRAIALDPDNDAAHRLLGLRLYANQGRMDDAVAEVRHAVAIRPESFENHYRLGIVLFIAGRYQEAVDAYKHATELQPRRADVFTNLGAAYHYMGDVKQAIGNYEHAIGLGAGDAQGYANLAVSYFFAGRHDDALRTCLEAIRRDPTRASLQRDLGDYYLKLGRTREARAAYARAMDLARQSIAVNPRDSGSVAIVAQAEAHLGDRLAAEGHVAEALTLSPEDRDIQMRAAKTYIVLGDTAAALEHLRLSVERGYPPQLARDDPELTALASSPGFEDAVAAGLRARARAGTVR
jgi:eukaryotic-like serine/threonine-protein kinase